MEAPVYEIRHTYDGPLPGHTLRPDTPHLADSIALQARLWATLHPCATFEQRELLVERVAEALGCL
ncbi:hypothetical protein Tasa_041_022 [Tanticharoenia sakaeratensis NBRC 103193]|uniref:Uncharacterized protein n=1 Tax=Tanticharoenia sakaeratensis NBRC 103193 TaxID=1231623 RepID=A0A0D6MNF2_9PROT|nr:hypothetical protein Tasa_041_022 [Tanticharoenia sakaeratensis NBRC 103193]GBQ23294.1 hypothetical protein AA103193_2365 [Tanticharoenia sakaeratensis NBRC 103193]